MSDNSGKSPVAPEELDQAFVKPLVNEAKNIMNDLTGQAIEQGQQAADPNDPQVQQQRQQQMQANQKKQQETETRRQALIRWIKEYEEADKRLDQKTQQEDQLKKQKEQKDKQDEQKKFQEKAKNDQSFEEQHIKEQQTKAERKGGVGG